MHHCSTATSGWPYCTHHCIAAAHDHQTLQLGMQFFFCMQGLSEMSDSSKSDATAVLDNCAERSLGIMCQKFIMLFLISSKVR
jgi:hypothetical protein